MKSRQWKTYERISRRAYKLIDDAGLADTLLRPAEDLSEAEIRYWRESKALSKADEYRAQARKLLPAVRKNEKAAALLVKLYSVPAHIVKHYRQNWQMYDENTRLEDIVARAGKQPA